jgi:hypothetical protein
MITPRASSPLRPVIAAFYETSHLAQAGWGKDDFSQTLCDVLSADGVEVTSAATGDLDLIVDGRVGVVILPEAGRLTDAARQSVREVLDGEDMPEVALILAFLPQPRIARVDAPLEGAKE